VRTILLCRDGADQRHLADGAAQNSNGSLTSVSCPSAETCVAVGDSETAGFLNQRGLIVTIRRA
jgi:hypothetical protein